WCAPGARWPARSSRARPGAPRSGALALAGPCLGQVPLQEVVEERADDGDRAELADRLPARADRGFEDVRGQLERESGDQPACVAQPDVAPLVARLGAEQQPQAVDECLERADDDDERGHGVDDHDRALRQPHQPGGHRSSVQRPDVAGAAAAAWPRFRALAYRVVMTTLTRNA